MILLARTANAAWRLASIPRYLRFRQSLFSCREMQNALLRKMVVENAETLFGRTHDFKKIYDAEDFRAAVPVSTYNSIKPFVDRIAIGELGVLTRAPVTHFALTAGTGGPSKLIPYTEALKGQFRAALAPWVVDLFRSFKGAGYGPAYWAITPALRRSRTDSGIPVGFSEDSAYLGALLKPVIDATLAVPGTVGQIEEIESFRRVTALCLLAHADLTLASIWHPSFLPLLWHWMLDNWNSLIVDLKRGFSLETPPLRLRARPERALALARLHKPDPVAIWPRLRLISCWGHGSAATYLPELTKLFPQASVQPKGILTTEAFVTIPFVGRQPLAITSHVFEFELPSGQTLWPWELEEGTDYTPLVTTAGGLYRYRINDQLRCTSHLGETPCLEFIGKAGIQSDRFGEKLEETFVGQIIGRLLAEEKISPPFVLLAPEETQSGIAYTLYIEEVTPEPALAARLDTALCQNVHYALCRRLNQLRPASVRRVERGAQNRYARRMMRERGQRLGDIKPMVLSPQSGWDDALAAEQADA